MSASGNADGGFVSSGDELEHEEPEDTGDTVEMVIVDPEAYVRSFCCSGTWTQIYMFYWS